MENQDIQKISMRREWLFGIILLLPFLYIPFIWNQLPDSIPTHWNAHGEVNDYSSKTFGTLFLPLLNVGMYLLFLILPKIDPRKKNYNYFGNTYRNIRLLLAIFMTIMFFITMQMALGNMSMNSKIVLFLVFGLIAILGNFMRTIRSNFFVGIRTPWTLDNPEVWRRTHEAAGKLWFYSSIIAIICHCLLIKSIYHGLCCHIWQSLSFTRYFILICYSEKSATQKHKNKMSPP